MDNLIAFLVLDCIVEVFSLLANGMFLITLLKSRSLHVPSNVLLGALCSMDLFISVTLQPTVIYKIVMFLAGKPDENLNNWLKFAFAMVFGMSFTIIILVSLDRYAAICHPFLYQRKASCRRHAITVCVCCLIASGCFALDYFIAKKNYTSVAMVGTTIAAKIVHFVLPVIIILFCYIKIYLVIRKQRRSQVTIGEISDRERTEIVKKKAERGKAWTISLVLLSFFLCYLPVTLWVTIRDYYDFNNLGLVSLWAAFIVLLSTILNPMVYYVRSKEVRILAKRILQMRSTNSMQ